MVVPERQHQPRPCHQRLPRATSKERGSGTALALAIIGATVTLAIILIAALGAHALHARLGTAADAAALAAADTASGRIPGDPCGRAAAAAALHRVRLASCEASHTVSTVTVAGTIFGLTLTASARGGIVADAQPP